MANPTTYFGWVMPNSADLVTDLPADFNVFGQGVDTSMQYLLGGTTGQVLSKTSGTNMAFTWINNDQGDITGVTAGTGITGGGTSGTVTVTNDMATTITTAGDLIKGTGSGTYNRLGIGSTGQVLTVASGAPSWATPATGTTFVGCSASGQTTLTNGATTYSLVMNSENFDTDGFHDNATNNTRFTVPTGKGGYYQINIRISYDNASATPGFQKSFVRKNGTGTYSITSSSLILANITTGTNQTSVGSGILSLAAADYIEVLVNTDNGSGTCVGTILLSISYIGA